jgi:hypothetical protein
MAYQPMPTELLVKMVDVAAKRFESGDVPGTDHAMRELFEANELVFGVWWVEEIASAMLLKGRDVNVTQATKSTAIPCLDEEDAEWHRFRFGDGPLTRH